MAGATMRLTMDMVWDRTRAILAERNAPITAITIGLLFLPSVVRLLVQAPPGAGAGRALIGGLVALVTVLLSLWGQLSLTAIALDDAPVPTRVALEQAARRLPAAIGVALVALLVVVLAFLPIGVAMIRAGIDPAAMTVPGANAVPVGTARFAGIYGLIVAVIALAAAVRFCVLYPVILAERRGLGAYARSFRLTRRYGLRLFGLLLLYIVVLLVTTSAAKFVVGAVAAIALGRGAAATLIALIAVAAVTAILSMVAVVFVARLYAGLRGAEASPAIG